MEWNTTMTDPWQMEVPSNPPDGPNLGSYSDSVPMRQDYQDAGASSAMDFTRGNVLDQGAPFAPESMTDQGAVSLAGGIDPTMAREFGAQAIVGLIDEPMLYLPQAPEQRNGVGLTLARAGAATDAGRPATAVIRGNLGVDVWGQIDNGLGMKRPAVSPLAAPPFYAGTAVPDALPSAGGGLAAVPAVDPPMVNTWRTPPTPWDDLNYLGGPP